MNILERTALFSFTQTKNVYSVILELIFRERPFLPLCLFTSVATDFIDLTYGHRQTHTSVRNLNYPEKLQAVGPHVSWWKKL